MFKWKIEGIGVEKKVSGSNGSQDSYHSAEKVCVLLC